MSVWLLPENISDTLPREARVVEQLRSKFLALVTSHGFEFVRPPTIEYVESLLTGTGGDLDLRTFKIVDQVSGRTLGFRADMTPQVARIDAHILNRAGVCRLCYAGSVLHARPLHPMASRQPYVAGLELFGSKTKESDLEVIQLGIDALHSFGLKDIYLDIGHVGLVKTIIDKDAVSKDLVGQILLALKRKDYAALDGLPSLKQKTIDALKKLTKLFGGMDVLDKVEKEYAAYPGISEIVENVRWVAKHCNAKHVSFDFSDVHGYRYLTGITFSVSIPGRHQSVLRGGRYDGIGAKFGRERPAVGLTIYLREIVAVMPTSVPSAIVAPAVTDDATLEEKIEELRAEGKIVVKLLPQEDIVSLEEAFNLDKELVCENGVWRIKNRQLRQEK